MLLDNMNDVREHCIISVAMTDIIQDVCIRR